MAIILLESGEIRKCLQNMDGGHPDEWHGAFVRELGVHDGSPISLGAFLERAYDWFCRAQEVEA